MDGRLICEQELLPGYVRLLSTLTYSLQLTSPPGKAFTIVDDEWTMVAASRSLRVPRATNTWCPGLPALLNLSLCVVGALGASQAAAYASKVQICRSRQFRLLSSRRAVQPVAVV